MDRVWEVTKQYVDADGNVVSSELFSSNRYEAFSAVYYVNGPGPCYRGPDAASDGFAVKKGFRDSRCLQTPDMYCIM